MVTVQYIKYLVLPLLLRSTRSAACNTAPVNITCPNSGLSSVPNIVNQDVENMDLQSNFIEELKAVSFKGLFGLKKLYLDRNKISYIEPGTFRDLTSLTELFLQQNFLTALEGGMLIGLQSLQKLYIWSNQITIIAKGMFQNLTSLEDMDLYGNQLTFIEKDTFQGLTALRDLYLDNNDVKEIEDGAFDHLQSLEDLHLTNNKLTSIPSIFCNRTSLKKLFLGGNVLTSLPLESMSTLHCVTLLYLMKNEIVSIADGAFSSMANLTDLNIHDNEIAELPENAFSGATSLKLLSLGNNKLSALPYSSFTSLSNLESLLLYRNPLRSVDNSTLFGDLASLKRLRLDDTHIKFLAVDSFHGLSNLKTLFLNVSKLEALPPFIFQHTKNLTTLSLHTNNIQAIGENIFADINIQTPSDTFLGNLIHCDNDGQNCKCNQGSILYKQGYKVVHQNGWVACANETIYVAPTTVTLSTTTTDTSLTETSSSLSTATSSTTSLSSSTASSTSKHTTTTTNTELIPSSTTIETWNIEQLTTLVPYISHVSVQTTTAVDTSLPLTDVEKATVDPTLHPATSGVSTLVNDKATGESTSSASLVVTTTSNVPDLNTPASSDSNSKSNYATIVGLVVAVLGVGVIAFVLGYRMRHKQDQAENNKQFLNEPQGVSPSVNLILGNGSFVERPTEGGSANALENDVGAASDTQKPGEQKPIKSNSGDNDYSGYDEFGVPNIVPSHSFSYNLVWPSRKASDPAYADIDDVNKPADYASLGEEKAAYAGLGKKKDENAYTYADMGGPAGSNDYAYAQGGPSSAKNDYSYADPDNFRPQGYASPYSALDNVRVRQYHVGQSQTSTDLDAASNGENAYNTFGNVSAGKTKAVQVKEREVGYSELNPGEAVRYDTNQVSRTASDFASQYADIDNGNDYLELSKIDGTLGSADDYEEALEIPVSTL
eukprot:m.106183 g.106183  ORF g.106183 m.106183 type:complete len:943 (+) comp13898_c0_seq4:47-2875(+)